MVRLSNPNLKILMAAVDQLGPLADSMVFLGGCATGLLVTDVAAPPIRITRDVDVITEVASLVDYYRLAEKLRERGFTEDQSPDAPICRWVVEGVILDVMPTNPEILGFENRWYAPALANAKLIELPSGKIIKIVSAPYFLATKLEAFNGRGQGDYLSSHDIEDIVAVLDGRPEIVEEMRQTEGALRAYLTERFTTLLETREFVESLPGHLPADVANQARLPLVTERIEAIAKTSL